MDSYIYHKLNLSSIAIKKIYIIILITIFGCHYNNSEKWDPFYLNIKNCCNDTLVVKFIYNSGQLYSQKISSNSVIREGGASRREKGINSYDDHEKQMLRIAAKDKIIIQYSDEYKEIFTVPEFVMKAEEQMGKRGRGEWTLTLCPTKEP